MEFIQMPSVSLDFIEDMFIALSGKDKAVTFSEPTRDDMRTVAKEIIRAREQAKERGKTR